MRIIGKHKDYYDSANQFGYDENVTFVRNINYIEEFRANYNDINWKTELKAIFNNDIDLPIVNIDPDINNTIISKNNKLQILSNKNYNKYINYNPIFIWFAGSLILCYEIKEYTKNNLSISTYDLKRYYVYGEEMISKIIELEKKYSNKLNIDNFRNHVNNLMKNLKIINGFEIAKKYNTAYFLVYDYNSYDKSGTIISTPSLKDIHFFKEMNYIQAWQRIESFLPSLKTEIISEMTNEQKIISHGMNKTSFRYQAPGKKKENRKRNKKKKKINL